MNAAPQKISPPRPLPSVTRFAVPILAITVLGILAMVYFFNPSAYGFYPVCQFHRITGLNCPGCGATRALYALLHGDIARAARDNVLLVAVIPLAAARGGWFAINRLRGRPNGDFFRASWLVPSLVVLGVFAVLRNLPAFSFLSP